MIRPIMKDVLFLAQKSAPATPDDVSVADDLLDTLRAHSAECVGMAANMIGVKKCIIAVDLGGMALEMFNPRIISKSVAYEAVEGCLSLCGARSVTRYRNIKVEWKTRSFQTKTQTFTGNVAQIIQHEIDHCNGVII
ncbi:MAG: peptide deformylase [Clostridia bacterium]|nr:peptide deformylase [Clostridia bacterium]